MLGELSAAGSRRPLGAAARKHTTTRRRQPQHPPAGPPLPRSLQRRRAPLASDSARAPRQPLPPRRRGHRLHRRVRRGAGAALGAARRVGGRRGLRRAARGARRRRGGGRGARQGPALPGEQGGGRGAAFFGSHPLGFGEMPTCRAHSRRFPRGRARKRPRSRLTRIRNPPRQSTRAAGIQMAAARCTRCGSSPTCSPCSTAPAARRSRCASTWARTTSGEAARALGERLCVVGGLRGSRRSKRALREKGEARAGGQVSPGARQQRTPNTLHITHPHQHTTYTTITTYNLYTQSHKQKVRALPARAPPAPGARVQRPADDGRVAPLGDERRARRARPEQVLRLG